MLVLLALADWLRFCLIEASFLSLIVGLTINLIICGLNLLVKRLLLTFLDNYSRKYWWFFKSGILLKQTLKYFQTQNSFFTKTRSIGLVFNLMIWLHKLCYLKLSWLCTFCYHFYLVLAICLLTTSWYMENVMSFLLFKKFNLESLFVYQIQYLKRSKKLSFKILILLKFYIFVF